MSINVFTFDPYFRGSSALPIFAANFVNGLVKVFNCLIAFSLWEWGNCDMGKCNFTSRSDEKLEMFVLNEINSIEITYHLNILNNGKTFLPCCIATISIFSICQIAASHIGNAMCHLQVVASIIYVITDDFRILYTNFRCY